MSQPIIFFASPKPVVMLDVVPPKNQWITPSPHFGEIWGVDFWYYFYVTFAPLFSFILLARYQMLCHAKHLQLSWQLKLNLIVWLISLFFSFALYSTIFGKYATPYRLYNLDSEIIRGSLHIAATNTLPLSTTFLLLDRILAISYVGQRLNSWRRYLQWLSLMAILQMFFSNLAVLIQRTELNPANPLLTCTFSCRLNGSIKDLLLVKMAISIVNVVFGAIFVYLYLRYSRKLKFRLERKFNHTTLFVFISEICCNIVPTSIYLIGSPYLELMNAARFTTMMVTLSHVSDGLATAILYWVTRTNNHKVLVKIVVNPLSKFHTSFSNKKINPLK